MVQFFFEDVKLPKIEKQKIKFWINDIASIYAKKIGDISFIFVSDEKILNINNQYLNHDYYTDIITFDYSEGNKISGDIFISLDTVQSNASELNINFNAELHRILIHGILHLCGIDDKTPELRLQMTENENMALSKLQNHDIFI